MCIFCGSGKWRTQAAKVVCAGSSDQRIDHFIPQKHRDFEGFPLPHFKLSISRDCKNSFYFHFRLQKKMRYNPIWLETVWVGFFFFFKSIFKYFFLKHLWQNKVQLHFHEIISLHSLPILVEAEWHFPLKSCQWKAVWFLATSCLCPTQGSPAAMDPVLSFSRQPSCMAFTEPPRAHKPSLLFLDAPLDNQPCLCMFYVELEVGSSFLKILFIVGPLQRLWLLSVKKLLLLVVVNHIWWDSSSCVYIYMNIWIEFFLMGKGDTFSYHTVTIA